MTDVCRVCGLPLEIGEVGCIVTIRPHARPILGLMPIGDAIDETHENLGHEPVHFSSRAEKKRYLKEHGILEFVRHVGTPGSDRSPHTQRWV